MKTLWFVFVLAFASVGGAQTLRAGTDDLTARLSIAMRQATLVHAMNKSACFAMGGIDRKGQEAAALEHVESFETALAALREGHDWLGLSAVEDVADLAAIATAEAAWRAYRPAIDQIIARDLHSVVMQQILSDADPTADSASTLARHFADTRMPAEVSDAARDAMDFAAHTRALTQRALSEMCFVLFGIGGDTMVYRLGFTLEEIDANFATLSTGSDALAPPPSQRVSRNLRTAALFWSKMRPTIDAVQSDTPPDALAVQKMLKLNKSVLKQLEQVVVGYIN